MSLEFKCKDPLNFIIFQKHLKKNKTKKKPEDSFTFQTHQNLTPTLFLASFFFISNLMFSLAF